MLTGASGSHVRRCVRADRGTQQVTPQESRHVPQQPAARADLQQWQSWYRL